MTTTIAHLAFSVGETWLIPFQATDQFGAVLPIASAQWRMAGADDLVLDVEAEVTNGGAGEGLAKVEPAETGDVKVGVYQHELRVTAPDGTVSIQAIGSVDVRQSLFKKFA